MTSVPLYWKWTEFFTVADWPYYKIIRKPHAFNDDMHRLSGSDVPPPWMYEH